MEYFSLNSFLLGTLLFLTLYMSNLIYCLFCLAFKVRIIEFSLNFPPVLLTETVGDVKYKLGCIPFGGYIKAFGMGLDDDEISKISEADKPFAFFSKPKYLKTIFSLVPWVVYVFGFIIGLIVLSGFSNFVSCLLEILSYTSNAAQTMFADDSAKDSFIHATKTITAGKNLLAFGFVLISICMLLLSPLIFATSWTSDENNNSKVKKLLGFFILFGTLWLIFWKIPVFIFSFFTIGQSLVFVASFIIGMFTSGIVGFFTTLFVAKNISENLNQTNSAAS